MDSPLIGKVIKAGLGGIAITGLLLGGLSMFQEKLMYLPSIGGMSKSPSGNPIGDRHPGDWQLDYENISTKTVDGITLRGWLIKQQNHLNKPTVVFFHENAGNIGMRMYYFKQYFEKVGVNILVLAYRGYSDSDDVPKINEIGLQQDSQAILKYAFESGKIDKKSIILHGRSLGGAVLSYGIAETQAQYKPIACILENTFTSMDDMVDSLAKPISIFKRFILNNHWKSIQYVQTIKTPCLFIQSMKDELVPPRMMQELFDKSASTDKILFSMKNGTHNDNWATDIENYCQNISSFIEKQLANVTSNL